MVRLTRCCSPKSGYLPGIWTAAFLGLFLTNGIFALGWYGSDLLLPAGFVGTMLVATILIGETGQRSPVPRFVLLPFFFVVGWRTLSFVAHPSSRGMLDAATLLFGAVAFLVAASIGRPGRGWEPYLVALVAAGLPTGVLAGLALVQPWFVTGDWRAMSTIGNPNLLSAVMAPLAVLAVGPLVWRSSARAQSLGLAACALMLVAIHAAKSRGGLLAFILAMDWLALVATGALSPGVRRWFGFATVLGALLVAWYASRPFVPHQTTRVLIDEARFRSWSVALRMVARHPLTGVGVGRFVDEALPFPEPGQERVPHAHSLYLQYAAETGMPALIGLLAFLLGLAVTIRRTWHQVGAEGRAFLAVGSAAILAMLVHGLVDYVLWSPACGVLFWTIAGILAGCGGQRAD